MKMKNLEYLDVNNLYGGAMSEPLPVNDFEWMEDLSKIDEDFRKNYDKYSDKEYILEVDVEYPKNLHDLHSDLPFLSERMKVDKCNKLVCNLYDKKCYVVHIRSLKQGLNQRLILTKVHRVIQFNQKLWLKLYVDMNTELRKQAKNDFEKDFFKLMNTAVFEKTMENVRKHRDDKKAKGTKKCVIKRRLKINDYKDCLSNNETIVKSQQRFKSENHDVYTEEINKIALSSNDGKRLKLHHILMEQLQVKCVKQSC